jgi:hypothetical protein
MDVGQGGFKRWAGRILKAQTKVCSLLTTLDSEPNRFSPSFLAESAWRRISRQTNGVTTVLMVQPTLVEILRLQLRRTGFGVRQGDKNDALTLGVAGGSTEKTDKSSRRFGAEVGP